jgi:hypothetical protein
MVEDETLNLPLGGVLDLADAGIARRIPGGAASKPGKIVLEGAD